MVVNCQGRKAQIPIVNSTALAWVGVLVVVSQTRFASAQCTYDVTPISAPYVCGFGLPTLTFGVGLNENGVVVGSWRCPLWDHNEGFVWTSDGGFVTIARPPDVTSMFLVGINDNGIVVGTYILSGVGFRGFIYDRGQFIELPPPPGGSWSQAVAINNTNRVTGWRSIGSKGDPAVPYNAFVWSAKEGFIDLGTLNASLSEGTDVNNAGMVTGWAGNSGGSISEGFIWHEGELRFLGPIPEGFTTMPFAISDNGVLVGSGRIPMKGSPLGAPRAFLWRNGTYTMLGTLPGHAWSRAHGVSPNGRQVVGRSWNVDGNPGIAHAFFWQNGVLMDMDGLIDTTIELVITCAGAVNSHGNILANATLPGGGIVAVLLTPVDPPVGDLDIDCRVGIVDFLILLGEWGKSDSAADFNGDGTVDEHDFAILLDNWG